MQWFVRLTSKGWRDDYYLDFKFKDVEQAAAFAEQAAKSYSGEDKLDVYILCVMEPEDDGED